ncbi:MULTISPECIES: mechanosensitive ion channel family protein [Pacificimonas]|uniref:Mechanosensitive ion channel family protein n=1 Tax=Pacificimonas aurantium TaxID=1250540 RepID=A0ABS7WIW0_9SPHN|nr:MULTISPECIES: mechanosensitive ion channel family protein [Pacificimonas]MBZ6378324.1 mechanosensitive ion channel family protein [Pacificimonas aurantium]
MIRLAGLFAAIFAAFLILAPAGFAQSGGGPYAYSVDAVNPGLGPVPEDANLETPQALLETFWFAGEVNDWDTAQHALDLSHLSPADQAARGEQLARELHTVIKRSMLVDWAGLSDRPDAVMESVSSDHPLAGQARRNISLETMRLPERTVSLRISRLDPANGDPVWLFSKQTVDNIPMLYERFGPTPFEEALPASLRKQAFWTLAWWEVIALPIVFILALLAAAGTFILFRKLMKRTDGTVMERIAKALRFPAALFAFVGTFLVLRETVFVFSGVVKDVLDPLQTLIMVVAVAAIILSLLEAVLDLIRERRIDDMDDPEHDEDRNLYTSLSAVRRLFLVAALLVGAAFVIFSSGLSDTLGFSMLASAGLLGLILVFAARSALSNIMASMQIVFSKVARVGDAVMWEDDWCYVEKIGLSHVQLRTWHDRRLMVPVDLFASTPFENWTKTDPSLLRPVSLFLDHRTDIDQLRQAFEKFVSSDDDVICKDEASVQVVGHSDRAMEVRFLVRADNPSDGWDMHCRLREAMLIAAADLDASGEPGADTAVLPREREVVLGKDGESG